MKVPLPNRRLKRTRKSAYFLFPTLKARRLAAALGSMERAGLTGTMTTRRNARILAVKAEAGRLWWDTYLGSRWADVNRRVQEAKSVYWEPASEMPVDLFAYVREASLCFSIGRFLAALSLSGALVNVCGGSWMPLVRSG